jgi:hypothetical protein
MYNVLLNITSTFFSLALAKRWNLEFEMSDYFFVWFQDVVFSSVALCFSTLPTMALFAKVTPKRIEGTMFAFLTGTSNFDSIVI